MKRSGKIVVSKSNSSSSLTCSCWHLHAFGNRQRPHIRHIESHTKPCECGLRVPTPPTHCPTEQGPWFLCRRPPAAAERKEASEVFGSKHGFGLSPGWQKHREGTSADELSRNPRLPCSPLVWCSPRSARSPPPRLHTSSCA